MASRSLQPILIQRFLINLRLAGSPTATTVAMNSLTTGVNFRMPSRLQTVMGNMGESLFSGNDDDDDYDDDEVELGEAEIDVAEEAI